MNNICYKQKKSKKPIAVLVFLLCLTGCTHSPTILPATDSQTKSLDYCPPLAQTAPPAPQQLPRFTLSSGDRIRVDVHEGTDFSGIFEIDMDGQLHIPHLQPLATQGLTLSQLQQKLSQALLDAQLLRPDLIQISITPLNWAGVQVQVSGAVFHPGPVTINAKDPEFQAQRPLQKTGQHATGRFLTQALANAGGVRPDADIQRIRLTRGNQSWCINLQYLYTHQTSTDIPLIAGDHLEVPSQQCLQNELLKTSAITPPGFRVFISNLSIPADANAKAAIGSDSSSLPYGSRLLQGVLAGNCVGGTQSTNARRQILHLTHHLKTRQPQVQEYALGQLLQQADNLQHNPYLMPNDGIACYDSGVTNIRDIARSFSDILTPLTLLRLLQTGSGN
ncbi:polysaccharide biosynthesis/export family protein [Candidatus Venteria ishoeyi]|uniref:polysaccharide biosynthesis/export family protein n=1 Tax=Candidatus Venteria ishoeyi TaxID=1899563 RepID=UPI0025A59C8C|nr:polysaccharide biosynthesis/export family protein [Candidatus Venteria ishoeyi]MDM8546543.1 polysaccharide biosynthesis/export family protein [Candidatus Venteria ishoeyi]